MKVKHAWFMNMAIRRKLLVSYFIIVIVPLVTLGIYSYQTSKRFVEDEIWSSINDQSHQISMNISNRLEKDNEFLKITSISPNLTLDIGGNNSVAEMAMNSNKYFEPVTYYNISVNRDFKSLLVYYNELDRQIGSFFFPSSDIEDSNMYQEVVESKSTKWYAEGEELIAARRIYDVTAERLKGLIVLEMDFDYIMESVVAKGNHPFGLVLVDKKDQVIYELNEVGESFSDDFVQYMISNPNESQYKKEYMYTSISLEKYEWEMYYFVPLTELNNNLKDLVRIIVAIVVLCLIVLIIISLKFSETITSRLQGLNETMKNVENGSLDLEIQSDYKDEIGQLTNRFGAMLNEINVLIDEVYKSELTLKETELKALQSQINPHFLYNVLSLINWKAIDAGNQDISDIAGYLSKFYRTSLNKGNSLIRIHDELMNVKAYVEIQHVMHGYSFDMEYLIDPNVENYATVNLSLQPIVENAIVHGIDNREDPSERGKIILSVSETIDQIIFVIEDNGIGMTEDQVEELLVKDIGGYGMKNVNERICLLFGNESGIKVESKTGIGTKVTLIIKKQLI